MPQLSKLQIRAKVLSIISEIKSLNSYNDEILNTFASELNELNDYELILDIFIKEFAKLDEKEYTFSSLILKEIIPTELIMLKTTELIKSNSFSDEYKYKLIQLLKITGAKYDYAEMQSYFDNPEDVMDKETKRLLETAVFNPESMLDFLDFVSTVSERDRNLLLKSLQEDYKGDMLANIVYPILYSDFDDTFILNTIDILINSKSSLAIEPFNYLIETSSNPDIINECKLGLKKLKLAGATKEKADEYFKNIVKTSLPAEFLTTIPDGNGNQAILITRCNNNEKFLLTAVVINDKTGIVDCFGFYNIAQDELIKVITKFYSSEGKYKISAEYAKTRVQEAINLTISLKRKFPYEFICWLPVLSDIQPLDNSVKDIVISSSRIQRVTKEEIINILTIDYTLRWFITPDENIYIKQFTDEIYSADNLDIKELNKKILSDEDNKVFDEKTTELWKNRIFNLIYLLRTNNKIKEADIFYTMLTNEIFFKLFRIIVVQRSIFTHFVALKENLKNSIFTTNIFRKRNSNENNIDSKKIDNIIGILKRNWING